MKKVLAVSAVAVVTLGLAALVASQFITIEVVENETEVTELDDEVEKL